MPSLQDQLRFAGQLTPIQLLVLSTSGMARLCRKDALTYCAVQHAPVAEAMQAAQQPVFAARPRALQFRNTGRSRGQPCLGSDQRQGGEAGKHQQNREDAEAGTRPGSESCGCTGNGGGIICDLLQHGRRPGRIRCMAMHMTSWVRVAKLCKVAMIRLAVRSTGPAGGSPGPRVTVRPGPSCAGRPGGPAPFQARPGAPLRPHRRQGSASGSGGSTPARSGRSSAAHKAPRRPSMLS